nr:MAG TPA: hypothetical protein [Caudoviricetes sp.]
MQSTFSFIKCSFRKYLVLAGTCKESIGVERKIVKQTGGNRRSVY